MWKGGRYVCGDMLVRSGAIGYVPVQGIGGL